MLIVLCLSQGGGVVLDELSFLSEVGGLRNV